MRSEGLVSLHDPATGRLKSALSMSGIDEATADNLVLGYDELGNLKFRHRSSGNPLNPSMQTNESYCYDTLNRLTKTHTGTQSGSCGGTADTTYDAFGNLREKNALTYDYPTGAGAVRPHAVTNVKTAQNVTVAAYTYDTNGNMTGDTSGRTFTYSVFDQMTQVQKGTTDTLTFTYGADRQRNYRTETVAGSTTKTFYMGSAERVELPGGAKEIRRRIGNEVVVIHSVDGSGTVTSTKRRFQMVDHLGSPVAVYDANATMQEHLSFGTWGDRRNFDTTLPPLLPYTNITTDTVRGYTGHEHGDAFGIIHMNGRIYDPTLGRMLQADPFVQFQTNTQSYNRYSYVLNNPLAYTDPSGYFLKELFNVAVDIGRMVYGGDVVSPQQWGNLAKDIYLLADALNEKFKSNPSSYNFAPGIAPGAFTNLTGPVQAGSATANRINPYPWDPTTGSIIGATYSDMTGRKFPNGAASSTFMILRVGQPEEERRRRENAQREKNVIRDDYLSWPEADQILQNNSDPYLVVVVRADMLVVKQTSDWFVHKETGHIRASGRVTGIHNYLVHGQVTIRDRGDSTFGIYQGNYDFEQRPVNSVSDLMRNVETYIGGIVASDGTPYVIQYDGNANVIQK